MAKDYFSKHYGDPTKGYTEEEARAKAAKVNEAYASGYGSPWETATIEPDPTKKEGYRVVIKTKK